MAANFVLRNKDMIRTVDWSEKTVPRSRPHPTVEPLEERSGPEMWQPISCSEARIWSELLIEAKKQCHDPCLTPPLSLWKSGRGRRCGSQFRAQKQGYDQNCWLKRKNSVTIPASPLRWGSGRAVGPGDGAANFVLRSKDMTRTVDGSEKTMPRSLPHPSVEALEERSGPEMAQPISCSEARIWPELLMEAKKRCHDPCLTPPLRLWKSGRARRWRSVFVRQRRCQRWFSRKNQQIGPKNDQKPWIVRKNKERRYCICGSILADFFNETFEKSAAGCLLRFGASRGWFGALWRV